MRKSYLVGVAVAAALSSTGAFALTESGTNTATIKLVVSGASAQRDTFRTELQKLCKLAGTGAGNDFDFYVANDGVSATSEDFRVYSCTLDSNANNANVPTAIQNQTVAVWYRAEGGSVYGIGPLLAANPTFGTGVKQLVVDNGAPCTNAGSGLGQHDCTISGYNLSTDTDTTVPSRLANQLTQLGVSDVEPKQFVGVNWPLDGTSVLGSVPTGTQLTQLNTLNTSAQNTTGTVFGILVSSTGPTAGLTNISREAVTSIFSGQVGDWSQINDGTGNPLPAGAITVCRREPGSGTQVAAGIYFTATGCSTASLPFLADPAAIEVSTSGLMSACVGGANTNRIGFASFGSNPTGAKFIALDGVAPSAGAAALGNYQFAFEATSQKRAGLAGTSNTLANTLISFAQKQTALTAGTSAFALPQFNGGATFAQATNVKPIALGTRSKSSCKSPLQVN